MGLGFVLIIWAVIGLILSAAGAVFLSGATAFLTRRVPSGRFPAIVAAGLFPFVCFAWAGCIFMFQAVVNEAFFDRDPGMGDTWRCPLPNGYEVLMIDVTDHGWVYNPKTQSASGGVGEQEDAVSGVRLLQVSGPYILGAADRNAFEHLRDGGPHTQVDSYFILHAQSGRRTTLPDYAALEITAHQLGIRPNLEPISQVYATYRGTWFDVLTAFLFFGPVIGGLVVLIAWVVWLRQKRVPATEPLRGT